MINRNSYLIIGAIITLVLIVFFPKVFLIAGIIALGLTIIISLILLGLNRASSGQTTRPSVSIPWPLPPGVQIFIFSAMLFILFIFRDKELFQYQVWNDPTGKFFFITLVIMALSTVILPLGSVINPRLFAAIRNLIIIACLIIVPAKYLFFHPTETEKVIKQAERLIGETKDELLAESLSEEYKSFQAILSDSNATAEEIRAALNDFENKINSTEVQKKSDFKNTFDINKIVKGIKKRWPGRNKKQPGVRISDGVYVQVPPNWADNVEVTRPPVRPQPVNYCSTWQQVPADGKISLIDIPANTYQEILIEVRGGIINLEHKDGGWYQVERHTTWSVQSRNRRMIICAYYVSGNPEVHVRFL